MEVHASLKQLRVSPRKVRLVADVMRGQRATDALIQLGLINKRATAPLTKLLKSAMANAEHNYRLDPTELVIKQIKVDGGFTLKRYRPRAFGRASMIRKRSSHVTLVLEGKGGLGKAKAASAAAPSSEAASAKSKPVISAKPTSQ